MIEVYLMHLVIMIGIYVTLSVGLNLTMGFAGVPNLGHVAFFGIGAYTSALLSLSNFPFLFALVVSGLTGATSGLLLILLTHELKGGYMALATLSFSSLVYVTLLNWEGLTRGTMGIPGIPKPGLWGVKLAPNTSYALIVLTIMMISLLFARRLTASPYGRLWIALRDNEVALSALGKNIFRLKAQNMMISAFFAGIAGSLFAHQLSYIDPSSFYLSETVLITSIVVLGGLASLRGTVIATIIILLIPEALYFLNIPAQYVGPAKPIIYASLLLIILIFRPNGLLGKYSSV
jgi:branched-chain amino acid transport system permease protein